MQKDKYRELLASTINHLDTKKNILFLTTSTRWSDELFGEKPKSTQLAYKIAKLMKTSKPKIIEVPNLKIYPCEGNVSTKHGNNCGPIDALLDDKKKNPSGFHRCWASLNNGDDELWKISKEIFVSDCIVFFGSIRWGQLNSIYQKLIERLTWIENRQSTLGEENIVKNIDVGIITIGQNWNGQNAVNTQKEVLKFFGFNVVDALSWSWQFTDDAHDESQDGYKKSQDDFEEIFIKT